MANEKLTISLNLAFIDERGVQTDSAQKAISAGEPKDVIDRAHAWIDAKAREYGVAD